MTTRAKLTENVRVRMTPAEKAELERAAELDSRTPASLARLAIRLEVGRILRAAKRGA